MRQVAEERQERTQREETLARKFTGANTRVDTLATEIRRLRDAEFERSLRRPEADGDYRLRVAKSLSILDTRIKVLEPKEPPAPVTQTFDVAVTVTPRKEK
jgi:hypothetical protein